MKPSKNGADSSHESPQRSVQRSKFRYRVVQGRPYAKPSIFWLTNDRDYATLLINVIRKGRDGDLKGSRVWLEEWCESFGRFSWRYVEEKSVDTTPAGLKLKAGDRVPVMLLDERTRRGGWRANVLGSSLIGPITNSEDVPREKIAGDVIALRIGSVNEDSQQIHFRWDPTLE